MMLTVNIDTEAVVKNYLFFKQISSSFIPMLKANCYYHGNGLMKTVLKLSTRICVDSVSDAMLAKRFKEDLTVFILGGIISRGDIKELNHLGLIPVLGDSNIEYAEEGDIYAAFVYNKFSCIRRNCRTLRNIHNPVMIFDHVNSFENPYISNAIHDYTHVKDLPICVGSTVSTLRKVNPTFATPRIGLGLYGYSPDKEEYSDLSPVKCVHAVVLDDLSFSDFVGYGYLHKSPYKYVISAGEFDNLLLHNVPLKSLHNPKANIRLIPHMNMVHSYIASDVPLPIGSTIELLGNNVRADSIAKDANVSVANVLKLGVQYAPHTENISR